MVKESGRYRAIGGELQRTSVTIVTGCRFALRVLEGTVAANLPATPAAIDYHLIIGRVAQEIFHHMLIIVGVAPTIKLAPFSLLAGDSG